MTPFVELKAFGCREKSKKKDNVVVTVSCFALLILETFLAGPSKANAASASDIDLRISVTQYNNLGEHYDMLFQNYDDRPIVIKRIVINKKAGTFCDYKGDELLLVRFPFRLDYGDSRTIGSTGCGRPIHLDVYTDRGIVPLDIDYK